MYVFLVHWQVWPVLERNVDDHVAFALTILVGVSVGLAVERAWTAGRRLLGRTSRRTDGRAARGLRLSTV